MSYIVGVKWILTAALPGLMACSNVRSTRRILPAGPSLAVQNGPPVTPCERKYWLYAAPSYVELETHGRVFRGNESVRYHVAGPVHSARGLVVYSGADAYAPLYAAPIARALDAPELSGSPGSRQRA